MLGSEALKVWYYTCCRDRDGRESGPSLYYSGQRAAVSTDIFQKAPAQALLNGGTAMAHIKESKPFYHSDEWKKVRAAALMRDAGMCCDCMDKFRAGYGRKPRRATMVHHLQSIEKRPDLALDLGNLRSLCDACHNKRHPEKGRRQAEPRRTRMRVIKV